MTYCEVLKTMTPKSRAIHQVYHDTQYGFPLTDDNELFGRLILEINQAGLSWETILKKQDDFRRAFDDFVIEKIAAYDQVKIDSLLSDATIVRNRLKILAVIHNAQVILTLQKEYGSFSGWLNAHHPLSKEGWVKLFKKNFKFVGGEIVNEFLVSTGYLAGAHQKSCPIYQKVLLANPKWCEKT